MIFKPYFDAYLQSIALIWNLDSNRRGIRIARYIAKGLFKPVASLKWAFALKNTPELSPWFRRCPRLLLKPGRHYINRNFNFDSRVRIIFNHYAMLVKFLSLPSLEYMANGNSIILANLVGKNGVLYQISLGKTDKFDREGELILMLSDSTQRRDVFWFVFSFNTYKDRSGVEIGCIQGPHHEDARELIKRATKELHGIRPRNLLAEALYALTATWNITEHFGVCNRSRIYNGYETHADYDDFWLELGGTLGKNGMFRLPTELQHHQLSEVPSHHRSEYRRRIILRESLAMQMSMAARAIGTSLHD